MGYTLDLGTWCDSGGKRDKHHHTLNMTSHAPRADIIRCSRYDIINKYANPFISEAVTYADCSATFVFIRERVISTGAVASMWLTSAEVCVGGRTSSVAPLRLPQNPKCGRKGACCIGGKQYTGATPALAAASKG